jgi:hypothetical protein
MKEANYLNNVQELLNIAYLNNIFNMTTKEFREFEDFVLSACEKQMSNVN